MPDAFVTGGTGFIGGALVDRLVAAGRSVRVLVRTPAQAEAMQSRGLETVVGDVTEQDAVRRGARECRTVFHVAGVNALCLRDRGVLERVNVGGTRTVVRAAADAGSDRVVYTSSAATIGEAQGVVATETTAHRGSYLTSYERSKHLAEIAAFEEAAAAGIDLVALNPSSVQGPGRTSGTARILIAYLKGRLRYAVDGRLSLVFVDDVVDAHLAAERMGAPGRRYLVSGWTATVPEAVAALAAATGVEHRVRYVPALLLGIAARVVGAGYRLARRDAPLCSEMARAVRHGHAYDGSRVEREWGLDYTAPDAWLRETVEWYRSQAIV